MNEISSISSAAISILRNPSLNVVSESDQAAVSNVTSTVKAANPLPTASVSELIAKSEEQLTPETVSAAVEAGNTILKATNKNLQFQIDDATKQVVISIVDSDTGEVVRQIPTVEMLDFMRAMALQETNTGKLYQAKA